MMGSTQSLNSTGSMDEDSDTFDETDISRLGQKKGSIAKIKNMVQLLQ